MNFEQVTALVTALGVFATAVAGLIATLKGLKTMSAKQDANATRLAEVHEAVGAVPVTAPEVKQ